MNDPFLRFRSANPSFGSLRSKISIAAREVAQVKLEVSDTDLLPKSYHSSAYFEHENRIKTRFWLGNLFFLPFPREKDAEIGSIIVFFFVNCGIYWREVFGDKPS